MEMEAIGEWSLSILPHTPDPLQLGPEDSDLPEVLIDDRNR